MRVRQGGEWTFLALTQGIALYSYFFPHFDSDWVLGLCFKLRFEELAISFHRTPGKTMTIMKVHTGISNEMTPWAEMSQMLLLQEFKQPWNAATEWPVDPTRALSCFRISSMKTGRTVSDYSSKLDVKLSFWRQICLYGTGLKVSSRRVRYHRQSDVNDHFLSVLLYFTQLRRWNKITLGLDRL